MRRVRLRRRLRLANVPVAVIASRRRVVVTQPAEFPVGFLDVRQHHSSGCGVDQDEFEPTEDHCEEQISQNDIQHVERHSIEYFGKQLSELHDDQSRRQKSEDGEGNVVGLVRRNKFAQNHSHLE